MAVNIAVALMLAASPQAAAPGGVAHLTCRVASVSGATVDFPLDLKGAADSGEARIPTASQGFVVPSQRRYTLAGLPSLRFKLLSLSDTPGLIEATLFLARGQ
jgi:hypothetical protein